MPSALWLTLALLLVAPAAGMPLASATYGFRSFEVLDVRLDGTFPDDEARAQRRMMDSDRDGQVSIQEVDAARNASIALVNGLGTAIGLPTGLLFVDGAQAASSRVQNLTYHGAAGPVGPGPLTVAWEVEVRFPVSVRHQHVVILDPANRSLSGNIQMDMGLLSLVAPDGFRFTAAGGLPLYAEISRTGREVLFPGGLAGTSKVTLLIDPEPAAKEAPGLGLAPVFLALTGAILEVRRRRCVRHNL